MKNECAATLLVIYAKPDFPTYFRHPLLKLLEQQGLNLEYIDTDSHSDDFYVDFILQSLPDKKRLFVLIEIDPSQKKLPNNCMRILAHLQKMKDKVDILCAVEHVLLRAYTLGLRICKEQDMHKQVDYIYQSLSMHN
ncbi:MAG: hypothetical protein NZ519_01905 [Bacteroidia bacterium]|nr:hypothetical protein [Bacteroidia bacterium]MDW8300935.1 hypothetical protein [Bacteroidia bacterium]